MKHEFQVEHLFDGEREREVGPWQCDECDATWMVRVRPRDEAIDVTPAPQRTWHNWDVLELVSVDDAIVRLVVPGLTLDQHSRLDEELGRKRYFYEEHTCPTNYLSEVAIVALGDREHWGDSDPHGLFRFVTTFNDPLRPHQLRSSTETNVLGENARNAVAKLGRS